MEVLILVIILTRAIPIIFSILSYIFKPIFKMMKVCLKPILKLALYIISIPLMILLYIGGDGDGFAGGPGSSDGRNFGDWLRRLLFENISLKGIKPCDFNN